jgi:hypothetical protein
MQIHVDTRDFHAMVIQEPKEIDTHKIDKYGERFYFTADEIRTLLDRLYEESGGEFKWRFLAFDVEGARNWELKYIRIFRMQKGFLICTGNEENLRAQNREFWSNKVFQEHLNAH